MRNRGVSGGFVIRWMRWVLCLILMVSCTSVPPTPAPGTDFSVKQSTDAPSVSARSLVPENAFYANGVKEFERTSPFYLKHKAKPSDAFRILDLPGTTGCTLCDVNSLSASLNWSPPQGFTGSDALTKDSPGLRQIPNVSGYGYGFVVLETGVNALGQRIATKVAAGFSIRADDLRNVGLYFTRSISNPYGITFTSSDGIHFTMESSTDAMMTAGDAQKTDSWCHYQYYMEGPVYPSSATLTLDPVSQSAVLRANYAGSISGSGWNWGAPYPDQPNFLICYPIGPGGSAGASVTLDFKVPFTQTDWIDIVANPASLPDGQGGKTSQVTVTPTEPVQSWAVDADSPKIECSSMRTFGVGTQTETFPFDAEQLTNGTYTLRAYYTSPLFRAEDSTEITVNLPVTITRSKAEFYPLVGDSVSFAVEVPPCPKAWTIELEGQMLTPVGTGLSCTKTLSGQGNSSVSWNGDCAVTDEAGQTITGKAQGVWTATLKWSDQSVPTSVTAITTPGATPTPCPPGEVCPTPSPCPSGEECPSPTPIATECPDPLNCPLECPSGQVCPPPTATPCPPGQVCASPSPTSTPSPTPTPTPTPTPPEETPTPPPQRCHGEVSSTIASDLQESTDTWINFLNSFSDQDLQEIDALISPAGVGFQIQALSEPRVMTQVHDLTKKLNELRSATKSADIILHASTVAATAERLQNVLDGSFRGGALAAAQLGSPPPLKLAVALEEGVNAIHLTADIAKLLGTICQKVLDQSAVLDAKKKLNEFMDEAAEVFQRLQQSDCKLYADPAAIKNIMLSLETELTEVKGEFQAAVRRLNSDEDTARGELSRLSTRLATDSKRIAARVKDRLEFECQNCVGRALRSFENTGEPAKLGDLQKIFSHMLN